MLIKYAKIFALGMGAIMASGVPSGNVVLPSAGSKTRPAKYYRLASPPIAYSGEKDAVRLDFISSADQDSHVIGVGDKPQPVDEAPARAEESSPEPTIQLGLEKFEKEKENRRNWSVLHYATHGIVIVNQDPGITRAMARRHKVYAEAPSLMPSNYGLFPYNAPAWKHTEPAVQQLASSAAPEMSIDPLDFTSWMVDEEPGSKLVAPTPVETLEEESVVPEPTGFLALLVGLPGLSIVWRRRKN